MDRLSGLDASFLYLETPEQLLHVCGLIVLDPSTMPDGYSFDAMRDEIDSRVHDVAAFTRKLRKVPLKLDHPIWVKDQHFDIDRHVHRLALPQPGGYDELVELAGHLAGQPLDRSRPLWEMWVIEGYDGDKVAVFSKMHHATVDGVSGSNLISHLCSLEADAPPLALGGERRVRPRPARAGAARSRPGQQPDQADRRAPGCSTPSVELLTKTIGRARDRDRHGRAVLRAADLVQRHHHRPPHDRLRRHEPRGHQGGQGGLRHDRQRRRARGVRRRPALLPRVARRAAVELAAGHGPGLGAEESKRSARRQQGLRALRQARHRRRGPARAARGHGRGQPERQGAPQARSAPTRSRTGRSSPRRARSASPSGRTPGSGSPSGTRSCTTWSSPTCPGRRCRCTSWAPGSRRSTRSARSSTAPASTSP